MARSTATRLKPKATPVDAIFPDRRTDTCRLPAAACRWPAAGAGLQLPDPRRRRGVRHRVAGIVAVALTAVLAGARSYAAIASWAADLSVEQRAQVGLTRPRAPDASTFRRVLGRLDAVVLDAVVGAFVWTRTATVDGRRVIALDGKTVRGARTRTDAGTVARRIWWPRSTTHPGPCSDRWRSPRKATRSLPCERFLSPGST